MWEFQCYDSLLPLTLTHSLIHSLTLTHGLSLWYLVHVCIVRQFVITPTSDGYSASSIIHPSIDCEAFLLFCEARAFDLFVGAGIEKKQPTTHHHRTAFTHSLW